MSEWIKANDKAPEFYRLVLVKNDAGDVCVGSLEEDDENENGVWRIGNVCVSWDYEFNYDYTVTEWMPLPFNLDKQEF